MTLTFDKIQPRPSTARKSVAFTEEKLVVAADGSVTMVASDETKDTAVSHATRTSFIAPYSVAFPP